MMMESSTKEVWVSYQDVCYQDIPRHAGVDGYPEGDQTALSRHLINQEHRFGERSSVWSLWQDESETVMYVLGSFPSESTKPIARQCQ